MAEIKVGDVVMLNSGGPPMTAVCHHDEGTDTVVCAWMMFDGTLQTATFPPACVKLLPPNALGADEPAKGGA